MRRAFHNARLVLSIALYIIVRYSLSSSLIDSDQRSLEQFKVPPGSWCEAIKSCGQGQVKRGTTKT